MPVTISNQNKDQLYVFVEAPTASERISSWRQNESVAMGACLEQCTQSPGSRGAWLSG